MNLAKTIGAYNTLEEGRVYIEDVDGMHFIDDPASDKGAAIIADLVNSARHSGYRQACRDIRKSLGIID